MRSFSVSRMLPTVESFALARSTTSRNRVPTTYVEIRVYEKFRKFLGGLSFHAALNCPIFTIALRESSGLSENTQLSGVSSGIAEQTLMNAEAHKTFHRMTNSGKSAAPCQSILRGAIPFQKVSASKNRFPAYLACFKKLTGRINFSRFVRS